MALDKSKLKTNLQSWMSATYDNVQDAADAFANAYENYALDAVDVSGDSPDVLNTAALITTFKTLTTNETESSAAIKFETAIINFWTGATFELTIPPAGTTLPEISAIVTTPPAVGSISTTLTTIFENKTDSASTKATQISDLLDTVTRTIIVTCVGTVASPPPPTLAVAGPIS